MRTTLTLDDDLAAKLKRLAFQRDTSFKQIVNETLRRGLESPRRTSGKRRYELRPAALGGVRAGIDLDRALRLADALEDEEIARELELRK